MRIFQNEQKREVDTMRTQKVCYKELVVYKAVRSCYHYLQNFYVDVRGKIIYGRKIEKITIDQVLEEAVTYAKGLEVEQLRYRFSYSVNESTLFNSIYVLMLLELAGKDISDKKAWERYLDSYQNEDGIWRDTKAPFRCWPNRSNEWNDIHIIPHIIYAYEAINSIPKKRFIFLDKFLDKNYTEKYCHSIDFNDFWGESNGLMNYLVCMIYARDSMNDHRYDDIIAYITKFLLSCDAYHNGLWGYRKDKASLYGAMRGGYHIWSLLMREKAELKNDTNVIDIILSLQNKYGGFDESVIASTCMNIDCIDPLARFSLRNKEYREKEVRRALIKAQDYLLHNRNKDGGFCFERYRILRYGNDQSISKKNESNLFATWFSVVALIIIDEYLGGKKRLYSELPGMEYHL